MLPMVSRMDAGQTVRTSLFNSSKGREKKKKAGRGTHIQTEETAAAGLDVLDIWAVVRSLTGALLPAVVVELLAAGAAVPRLLRVVVRSVGAGAGAGAVARRHLQVLRHLSGRLGRGGRAVRWGLGRRLRGGFLLLRETRCGEAKGQGRRARFYTRGSRVVTRTGLLLLLGAGQGQPDLKEKKKAVKTRAWAPANCHAVNVRGVGSQTTDRISTRADNFAL